jgi:hypothetical protein
MGSCNNNRNSGSRNPVKKCKFDQKNIKLNHDFKCLFEYNGKHGHNIQIGHEQDTECDYKVGTTKKEPGEDKVMYCGTAIYTIKIEQINGEYIIKVTYRANRRNTLMMSYEESIRLGERLETALNKNFKSSGTGEDALAEVYNTYYVVHNNLLYEKTNIKDGISKYIKTNDFEIKGGDDIVEITCNNIKYEVFLYYNGEKIYFGCENGELNDDLKKVESILNDKNYKFNILA